MAFPTKLLQDRGQMRFDDHSERFSVIPRRNAGGLKGFSLHLHPGTVLTLDLSSYLGKGGVLEEKGSFGPIQEGVDILRASVCGFFTREGEGDISCR